MAVFTSFVNQFTQRVIHPAIDAKMRATGEAWVAEASRTCPVDSGFMKSTINYTYNVSTKTLNLAVDAKYFLFVELGTRHRAANPFARRALSVVPRIWRGGLGSALTGHTVNLQAPNVAEKYHGRILAYAKGKTRGARLQVGHGRFR